MTGDLATYELRFGRVHLTLRELCGRDVLALGADDTRSALTLLDRLLVTRGAPAVSAAELTIPERDRACAEVYLNTFGRKISGSPRCVRCDAPYDTDFDLAELIRAVWPAAPARELTSSDGRRFRVPTGSDELALEDFDETHALAALTERCALDSPGPAANSGDFAAALERAAPVLDLELAGVCPECEAPNTLAFRMQSYLLRLLLGERARLASELDVLARAYGWSVSEILGLPRVTRLTLVRLAEHHALRRAG